jgi:predicted nucleotide-binding protein
VASQEAVFELGYIAAKFDRQHIVVLYQEHADFMMPTEFFDLFYIPITSSGAWKAEVVRRMKVNLAIPAGLGLSMENQPSV